MDRIIKFEYGFESNNGIVKNVYHLHEIPFLKDKCALFSSLNLKYVREYTGLKDKNKNPIYEGDICRIDYKPSYYQQSADEGVIVFANGSYKIQYYKLSIGVSKLVGFSGLSKKSEIIGNIYENKKLLSRYIVNQP